MKPGQNGTKRDIGPVASRGRDGTHTLRECPGRPGACPDDLGRPLPWPATTILDTAQLPPSLILRIMASMTLVSYWPETGAADANAQLDASRRTLPSEADPRAPRRRLSAS